MSNSSLVQVVETILNQKVQNNELFTAHDVTLEVRHRGHRVSHSEVRDAVHDYFSRGGLGADYVRTNISTPQGGTPFVYHRNVDDASSYSNIRGSAGPSNPVAVVQPNNQAVTIPSNLLGTLSTGVIASAPFFSQPVRSGNTPGKTKARSVDGRGTLSIPSFLVRELGFKPRQKVYVVAALGQFGLDGVNIVETPTPTSTVYGKYTVDDHGQVRLTQAVLKKAGIAGNQYDIERSNDKVEVKLSK